VCLWIFPSPPSPHFPTRTAETVLPSKSTPPAILNQEIRHYEPPKQLTALLLHSAAKLYCKCTDETYRKSPPC
jgi:hypothetical protein